MMVEMLQPVHVYVKQCRTLKTVLRRSGLRLQRKRTAQNKQETVLGNKATGIDQWLFAFASCYIHHIWQETREV